VDIINGIPGQQLKCDNRKNVTTYLRVGFDDDAACGRLACEKIFILP